MFLRFPRCNTTPQTSQASGKARAFSLRAAVASAVIAAGMPLAGLYTPSASADPASGSAAGPTAISFGSAVSATAPVGLIASGVVPDGVCAVKVTALGAAGASTSATTTGTTGGAGGAGAKIVATFAVFPGQSYGGSVGGGGAIIQTGGVGGGGAGGVATGHPGAGGGGRSVVTLAGINMIIAGGGGGGGASHNAPATGVGGAAGGTAVGAGVVGPGGTGGAGYDGTGTTTGGGGGTSAGGGAGGLVSLSPAANGTAGGNSPSGTGGNGGLDTNADSGGGGGSGYTGGGGGGSTLGNGAGTTVANSYSGSGGGGGSSWVAASSPTPAASVPTGVTGSVGAAMAGGKVAGYNGSVTFDFIPCVYTLSLNKTVSAANVKAGDKVVWTVKVKNTATEPMTKGDTVDLTDTLPPGPNAASPSPSFKVLSFGVTGGSNTQLERDPVTCTAVTVGAVFAVGSTMPAAINCSRPYKTVAGTPGLPSGGTRGLDPDEEITITYEQIIANTAPCATITNTAAVKDRPLLGGTATDITAATVSRSAPVDLAIDCYDLAITKTAAPKPNVAQGNDITWTIKVNNNSLVDMEGPVATPGNPLVVTDTFPTANVAPPVLVSSTGDAGACTLSANTISCAAGLPAGKTQTIIYKQTVSGAAPIAASITNTASVTDPKTGDTNDSATDSSIVISPPPIKVTKTADVPTYAAVGDPIVFTITAKNTGAATLTDVTVSDPGATITSCSPALPVALLIVGDIVTCTATHAVTQGDLDTGLLTNTASASGKNISNVMVSSSGSVDVAATQTPSMIVSKVASTPTFSAVGTVVSFAIEVTNSGNVTLSNVVVTDATATLGTCTPAIPVVTLAPGATVSCTATRTVTLADLDAGIINNTAGATASSPSGGSLSQTGSASATAVDAPALTFTKTPITGTYLTVGTPVEFSLLLQNSGNITLANVTITDTNATLGTCSPALPVTTFAPGASIACTATHLATQADLDAGSVINVAEATAKGRGTTSITKQAIGTVLGTQSTALDVVQSPVSTAYSAVGNPVEFSFTVTNNGNVTLTNVNVTDPNATLGTCTPPLPVATLAPGQSISCTATHTANQTDLNAGSVVNVVNASATAPTAATVIGSAPATVTANQVKTLTVTKTAIDTSYSLLNSRVGYTIHAENTGNVTLADVTVTDANATITSCTPTLPVASLAPAATIDCVATHGVTQADLDVGTIANTANAQSLDPNGQPVTGSSSVSVPAAQTKLLTVTKTALSTSYNAVGETISYTIDIYNGGNVSFHDVSVTDPTATIGLCTPLLPATTLLPGATTSCAADHVITQADLDAGLLSNTATANATDPQNNPVSVADTEVVNAAQTKALGVQIISPPLTYAAVGNVASYPITITNNGNVTLANLSTTLPAGVTFTCPIFAPGDPSTSLAPGASVSCTATRVVTQADLDAGTFLLTVSAVAADPAGGPVTGSDVATTTASQSPSMSVVKTPALSSYSAVGDAATFAITLTNTGNVTLQSIDLSDDNGILSICDSGLPLAQLAPGAAVHCTATHIVTQGELDAGSIVNNATGSATFGGTAVSGSDQATVNAAQIKSLTVVNTPTTPIFSAVGDVAGFSVTITNTGNVTLSGVTLTDLNTVLGVCTPAIPIASLAPGAVIICTATHAITQADIDAGSVLTTASATGIDPSNSIVTDADNATVVGSQSGALIVNKTKTVLSFAHVGDAITFTVTGTNAGNVTLSSVTLVDITATLSNCTPANPTTLAPGDVVTCTAKHLATQADIDAGTLSDTATGSGTTPTLTVVQGVDLASVPAAQTAAISLTNNTPTTTFNNVGDVITYAVDITNDGNVTLAGVALTDTQTLVLCTPGIPAASLAPGVTIHCQYNHVVTQTDIDSGSVIAPASVTGTSPTNSVVTASDTATVAAVQTDVLTVVNTTPVTSYATVGELINYTITLTNDGNTTLSGVSLTDPNATIGVCSPGLPTASLAPGETITCAAVHGVTQADLDAGSIANIASGTSKNPSGSTVNGADTQTVSAQQSSQLAVTNNADLPNYAAVGEVVTYSYTATNTGNVTLSALSITDPNTIMGTCTPAQPVSILAPGEVVTCTATHVVTQRDLDAGSIASTVSSTATNSSGATVNGSAPASVAAAQTKAITLGNIPSVSSYATVGTPVGFMLTITNTGNVTLSDVTLTDPNTTIGTCAPALPVTALAPGQTIVCEAVHVVTQVDLDAGSIVTVASTTGNDPSGSPVTATTPGTVAAAQSKTVGVTIDAAAPTFDTLGRPVAYAITFTNLGNVTLHDVRLTDPNIVLGTCTPALPVSSLAPGVTVTCAATHVVAQADLDLGSITSTAVVSGTDPNSVSVNGTATTTVNAVQTASLAAVATAVVSPTSGAPSTTTFAEPGQIITYTVVYTNTGNVTLSNITPQTPNANFGTCSPSVPVASLEPGATVTCTATHQVTQADIDAGLVNVAPSASAVDVADNPVASITSVGVPGANAPLLTVVATATETIYDTVAKLVHYSTAITNSGNLTLSNVGLTDPNAMIGTCRNGDGDVVSLPVAVLLPGQTITCEATHAVTQADLDAGSIVNTPSASAFTPKGAVVGGLNTSTVIAKLANNLAIVKVISTPTYSNVGDEVLSTITVTNRGNSTLTNVVLTDPYFSHVSCVPQVPLDDLAPGAIIVCQRIHIVSQDDLDGLTVQGTATVTALGPDGRPTSASSTARVQATIIATSTVQPQLVFAPVVGEVAPTSTVPSDTGALQEASVSTAPPKPNASPVATTKVPVNSNGKPLSPGNSPATSIPKSPASPSTNENPVVPFGTDASVPTIPASGVAGPSIPVSGNASANTPEKEQVADASSKKPTPLALPTPLGASEIVKITKQPESGTITVDPITRAVTFTPTAGLKANANANPSTPNVSDTYEIVNFDVCDTTTGICEHKSMRIRVLHANINADENGIVRSLAFTGTNSLILTLGGFLSVLCGVFLLLARRRKIVL